MYGSSFSHIINLYTQDIRGNYPQTAARPCMGQAASCLPMTSRQLLLKPAFFERRLGPAYARPIHSGPIL